MDSRPQTDVEIDVRALFGVLLRRLPYLIVFIILVAAGTYFVLGRIAPVYKSEATVFLESGESSLTRTTQTGAGDPGAVIDDAAIASQVQLIRSRDLAAAVSKQLNLPSRAEFDPNRQPSLSTRLLQKVGLAHPDAAAPEERALAVYFKNLTVTSLDKSRVIAIDFSSTNPQLAADVANATAAEYITRQRQAKRTTTSAAAEWLSGQIVDLRQKVVDAEARVEDYRSANDLFDSGGATPSTLPQQQLTDLNTELTKVRAARADAEAKAAQIRTGLASNTAPNLTDVLNSALIQSLVEQQVALRSQIAQLNATLLPGHPKMKELNAQVANLDQQIVVEARKILESLEAEAKVAAAREAELSQNLDRLKKTASTANDAGVRLRALEREAAADRDLLDSYLRSYREAVARDSADLPADARVVSGAAVATDPDFPKKVPMTAAATAAALLLAIAFILLRELASGRPMRRIEQSNQPMPIVPDATPTDGHARWADDHSVRRMMPSEPTLVPEMVDHVEESLTAITRQIIDGGEKRILVTLSEGSDDDGRPLGAVALSRSLARTDARVVLVDFRGDGADAASMGEGKDLPGFADLFDGEASFAQVIFRDRKSRVHFIPAGRKPIGPGLVDEAHLETILSALTLTYDYVLLDTNDDMIATVGPGCGTALVVSEHGGGDPRTVRAFDRVTAVTDAHILLLVVDPRASQLSRETADAEPEKTSAHAAA
jgi:polysaccharide biosynthesis transport protein